MSDQYLGEIRPTGFNFAPIGWALCQGQLLPIQQYTALFSLLGAQYGGNGSTTFALPNLQQNVVMGAGTGVGLPTYVVGEQAGQPSVTLLLNNMPIHTHAPSANSAGGANTSPASSIWATEFDTGGNACTSYVAPPGNVTLPLTTVLSAGGSQPLNVTQPNLAVNYIIALTGYFPARS